MMIGPIINGLATIVGGLGGAAVGHKVPEHIRAALPMTFGACSMAMGVSMIVRVQYLPAVILSMVLGALIGEALQLENKIRRAAVKLRVVIDTIFPPREGSAISYEEFMEKFVGILVLFCASGTGIFGAIDEGMGNGPTMLIAKSFLDLFTAATFAITLGYSVVTIALPQFIIQAGLFLLAFAISSVTTEAMNADFRATGGIIMLATGCRIANIKSFPIVNMLPALLIVMPISAFWVFMFVK